MHKRLSSQHVKCVRHWGYLQIKEMAPYLKAFSLVGQINKQTPKYNSVIVSTGKRPEKGIPN